ncbi:Trypsin domain containing protein [Asbolus verrucosus]|uniref:Trypsin domain containing protein n=1 Tax=Asbolus verrucosus TaxID=1661398 RepID=A0A482WAZ9_ASBVE|nr:Trypsin domain containing protein [Asbolus verrucosus]
MINRNPSEYELFQHLSKSRSQIHLSYDTTTYLNNIAVIELEKEIKFGDNVHSACLNTKTRVEEVALTEWANADRYNQFLINSHFIFFNIFYTDNWTNLILRKSNYLPFLAKNVTQAIRRKFQSYCRHHVRNNDTCKSNLQGALRVPNGKLFTLVALLSYGQRCDINFPTVFTKIDTYLDWIQSIVWK